MGPLNLLSQNQAKNIPVGLASSQIIIWGKPVKRLIPELWSVKQTEITTLYIKITSLGTQRYLGYS